MDVYNKDQIYFQFGNLKTGWMYYSHKTEYVKASNVVYLERQLLEYFLSTYHHGWISEESQAEAYNETWRDSQRVELVTEITMLDMFVLAVICVFKFNTIMHNRYMTRLPRGMLDRPPTKQRVIWIWFPNCKNKK